jgi:hypothetical protein
MTIENPPLFVRLKLHRFGLTDRDAFVGDSVSGPLAPESSEVGKTGHGWIEYSNASPSERDDIIAWLDHRENVAEYSLFNDWADTYPELLTVANHMKAQGQSIDDVLMALRDRCPSPIQSIKAISSAFALSKADAKQRLHDSRAWADRREEFEQLHAAAEDWISERDEHDR